MPDTILLGADRAQFLAGLSPEERHIAEQLLHAAPNYRYAMSGLPRLYPPPAPGPASAAAAAKAIMTWIKSLRFH